MDWTKSWAWGFCSAQLLLCIQGALTAKAINILEFARTKQSNRQFHLWIVSPKPQVVFYSKVLQESVSNVMLLLFLFSWEDTRLFSYLWAFLPNFRLSLDSYLFLIFFFVRIKEKMERKVNKEEKKWLQWVIYWASQQRMPFTKSPPICSSTFTLHANIVLYLLPHTLVPLHYSDDVKQS